MTEKEKNQGGAIAQSTDLNLIEMLWWDLKRAVHNGMPGNLN